MDDIPFDGTPEDPTEYIVQEILAERQRQIKAVGWSWDNDDRNTVNDWAAVISHYATSGTHYSKADDVEAQRAGLVNAAALCLAALEALERNGKFPPRHYD